MGMNAMGIRFGIEAASKDVVAALKSFAKPIKTDEEIRQVATVSAESAELGTIIADTIRKVGKDGVVTVEESQSTGLESEIVEGIEFDKGYVSPYMITNADRMEAEFSDPAILVTDRKISSVKEILPLLEDLARSGKKDLVIVAEDVDGEALSTFILNKLRGTFNVLAVKAPGYGDRKKDMLQDIAVTVGATVVTEEVGIKLDKADASMLGRARRVIATKDKTIIVGGKGKKADIEARVSQMKKQRESTDAKYNIEKLDERIAKLSGGVAVIRVGAATETEMRYLKLKIEDAVNATKAAIEEGIVAGGGIALLRAAKELHVSEERNHDSPEKALGYSIVVKALQAPLRQIAINAGQDEGAVLAEVMRKITNKKTENAGYDALKGGFVEDMIAAGIVDPVKVTRLGVENACSAAAILLTTEAAIADEPEEKKAHDHGAPSGEMGY